MKRLVSWIVVIGITILISIMLFMTGKLHKVMLNNGKKGDENIMEVVEYSIDKSPFKKIKALKKSVVEVKGISHIITVRFENENGEKMEITEKFKAKIGERENIDISKIVNNENDWLKYTKEKR
ncbi:DUF6672 family protein [Fusobacterium sp.]|uniref:DUF6672 family protein n=1 Tax=Fusobacterium sp. TaxID=68766 RepID=UPI002631E4AA|nr:DUF6672 family protein [Fusobacterium sp.]